MRLTVIASVLLATSALATPPATSQKPVTDTYHGVSVVDPYRWLENWDDPAVRSWSDAQNAHAHEFLDRLPNVAALRGRVTEVLFAQSLSYGGLAFAGGRP